MVLYIQNFGGFGLVVARFVWSLINFSVLNQVIFFPWFSKLPEELASMSVEVNAVESTSAGNADNCCYLNPYEKYGRIGGSLVDNKGI